MNVIDKYKKLSKEEIKKDLDSKRNPFSVLICNLNYCNNVGSILRSANIFNAEQVIIFGRRNYNRKAALGAYHYVNLRLTNSYEYLMNEIVKSRPLIACENNIMGSKPLVGYQWRPHSIIAFGSESQGLPADILYDATDIIEVTQYGCTRSLNVSVAAGIIMHECAKALN